MLPGIAFLKYLSGVADNTRLPGDVGLAQDHILIPWWDNIRLTPGVQPTRYGGVPTGFVARPAREAAGNKAKARSSTASRWNVYKGTITLHGRQRLAYIARPPRVPVETGETQQIFPALRGGHVIKVGQRKDIDHPRIPVPRRPQGDLQAHPGEALGGGMSGRAPAPLNS